MGCFLLILRSLSAPEVRAPSASVPPLPAKVVSHVEVSASVSYDIAKVLSYGEADVEDFAAGCVRFDNGGFMLIESAWAAYVKEEIFEVRILGTEGGAQTHPNAEIILKQGVPPDAAQEPYETQFSHFIRCIREGSIPDTDITAGMKVMKMLDALYRSAEEGKAVLIEDDFI